MKTPRDDSDKPRVEPRGPACYENWRAAIDGRPSQGAYEWPLLSDGAINRWKLGHPGRETDGPYTFILWMKPEVPQYGLARPAIVLRVELHLETESRAVRLQRMQRTDDRLYHGGSLEEEVAALLSLSLAIRLKAGGMWRSFNLHGDPRGSPYDAPNPALQSNPAGQIIPRASEARSLQDAPLLDSLPSLGPDGATALIRAARLYQDAMWIAESQPALSWLMFASAVETAANYWRSSEETPRQRLQSSNRGLELDELLVTVGGEPHAEKVAEMIADSLGSTKKFKDFIVHFPPAEPPKRPNNGKLPWDTENLRKSLTKIYGHRSHALHSGIPFPWPMCMPPMPSGNGVPVEIPEGEAIMMMGGSWQKEDLPMHLHTFEYIVQGALCKWWKDMVERRRDTAGGGCAT